jgi:hypothetical protein
MTSCDAKAPFCTGNGSISFGGNGRYTLVVFGRDRPKLTGAGTGPVDRTTASADAYKGIGQGTVAQFGTWSVDEATKTLTEHSENTFTRVNEGNDAKFSISLTGDELKITGTNGASTTWKKPPNPPQTVRQQLIGTWNLVSCDIQAPYCTNPPNGRQTFDASGQYTLVITGKGRTKTANNIPGVAGRAATTPEEYRSIAQGVVANFGSWSLGEDNKTVTFKTDGALFPNAEGTERKATVSINGDEMKGQGPILGNSTWRRSK